MENVSSHDFTVKVFKNVFPVVVVIWGAGWGFCRALKPQVETLAEEVEEDLRFYEMAAGPNRKLLVKLEVSGLPTFLFYKDGQESSSMAGVNTRLEEIREHTRKLLQREGK
jgi:thioredoxin 1